MKKQKYYPDSKQLKEEYETLEDGSTKNGHSMSFYKSGNLRSMGEFYRNKLDGKWKDFFDTEEEKVERETLYSDDERKWEKLFDISGNLTRETHFKDDRIISEKVWGKDGTYRETEYAGRELIFELFENSKKKETKRLSNGLFYIDKLDKLTGIREEFSQLKDGRKHGKYLETFPNGHTKKEGTYSYDEEDGIWKEFYENGTLKRETNYEPHKKEKTVKEYDEDGRLSSEGLYTIEGLYKLGKNISHTTYYKEGGRLEVQCDENGKEKYSALYDKSGRLSHEFISKNGKKVSEIFHSPYGGKKVTEFDDSGKEISSTEYDKNGQKKEKSETSKKLFKTLETGHSTGKQVSLNMRSSKGVKK